MNIEIYSSISEIEEKRWSQFVTKRFFMSYGYLQTMEKAAPSLNYRYALLVDESHTILAAAYFQIIPFRGQNLYNYIPTSNALIARLLKAGLSWIDTNLLVLGNVIFTCENGLKIRESEVLSEDTLLNIIDRVQKSIPSNVLGTMISENLFGKKDNFFCHHGFHSFRVEDRMEMLLHYSSIDDYKSNLQSKYRVRFNKIEKLNLGTEIVDIHSDNFEQYREEIDELFHQVIDNSKFKLTKLTSDYFLEFIKGVDRFHMKGFVYHGKMVAFVTYYELDTILEVHYVGLDYQHNVSHKVYNYLLYQMLDIAIAHGKRAICYGRTAQELKSTLGALPISVTSSLRVNNRLLNIFTPYFLGKLIPSDWTIRSPFAKKV